MKQETASRRRVTPAVKAEQAARQSKLANALRDNLKRRKTAGSKQEGARAG